MRIMNEPPSVGSSVFLVEAGERQALPETTAERLLDWLSTAQTSDRLPSHEYDLLFALPIS
jgi:hypothetical protein